MNQSQKPHYKILVIGKSGSGKSTAINMLLNQSIGVEYEDKRIIGIKQKICFQGQNKTDVFLDCNIEEFKNKQSDQLSSSSLSQTKDCNPYTIENQEFILTLVDTPGLGDTQGTSQDEKNIQIIISKVQSLGQINAILYIHKGGDMKVGLFLQYYIHQFKGMLTKESENNFLVCFTNVVNPFKIDACEALEQMGLPMNEFVYFENGCLIPPHLTPLTNDKRLIVNSYKKSAKQFWDSNKEQFGELIIIIKRKKPQKTKDLLDLLTKIKAMINLACEKQHQLKANEQKNTNLQQTKNSREAVLKDIINVGPETKTMPAVKYKDVDYQETIIVKEKIDGKLTFCYNCLNQCHNPCSLDEIYERGSNQLINCTTFNSNNVCSECSHSIDYHGNVSEISEVLTLTKQRKEPYTIFEKVKDEEKAEEVTIKYLDDQIQMVEKNKTIPLSEKKIIKENYEKAKQTYIQIVKEIEQAKKEVKGNAILNDVQVKLLEPNQKQQKINNNEPYKIIPKGKKQFFW